MLERAREALGIVAAGHIPSGVLRVRLGDIAVDIDAPPLVADFIAARFDAGPPDSPPDVVSRLRLAAVDVKGEQASRRVWRDADGALWCRSFPSTPGLIVRFAPGSPLVVDTWLDQSAVRQAYKRVVANVTQVARLEALTAYVLLYPALLAADAKGRFPLHAAAVAKDGRALLLAGAPGSGKSTLTAALGAAGCEMLSDNLVLLGSDGVWPFPEPIKLDQRSHQLAGIEVVSDSSATYSRQAVRLAPPPGPIAACCLALIEQGPESSCEPAAAVDVDELLELNRLAFELHTYGLYRALARLVLAQPCSEHGTIAAALDGVRVRRVVVAPGDVSDTVAALLAMD